MTFRHGVYTSEIETALQTAPSVDSALPFVVGAAKTAFEPTVVTSWRQFAELSGITEGVDDVAGEGGWLVHSLVSFAYLWFRLCGRGDCIMCGIASADGSLAKNSIISALDKIDTVYERVRRLPSIICVPYFANIAEIWTAIKTKAELYGGRFSAVAVGDIPCNENACSDASPAIISSPAAVAAAKTVSDKSLALFWPYVGIGDLRFDLSSVACAVMNRTDAQNGNLPFVSPSNKNCYATGVYNMPMGTLTEAFSGCKTALIGVLTYVTDSEGRKLTFGFDKDGATARVPGYSSVRVTLVNEGGTQYWRVNDNDVSLLPSSFPFEVDYPGIVEAPLFQNRDEVNTYLGANGIIGALNTANGWVLWGNNTTAFPGNTDVKDIILSERRMFNYVKNSFQLFAQPRIDNPLNRRQLEGVVNAFNQILASLQGFGALNAASVSIDDERNTTEQLIRGVVYFRIRIAPPPPMQEINGVFEFDVPEFEASLA